MTERLAAAVERANEMFSDPEEREYFEDDLLEFEAEQVFQDNEGWDDCPCPDDFGDEVCPDFE